MVERPTSAVAGAAGHWSGKPDGAAFNGYGLWVVGYWQGVRDGNGKWWLPRRLAQNKKMMRKP
ncbi:MAG: hypothetical protein IKO75_02960 [Bacteroidales bacterium]|nr:hypothetical protein [Bacteroidales bacterium]